MWESIDLQEVRAFLMVAAELHFGRAAERMCLTQSRVSQLVRSLEGRLGSQLFDRNSRRVQLTPLGTYLHDRLEPAYGALRAALDDTRNMMTGTAGTVRVGVVLQSSAGPHLLSLVRIFEQRYPQCTVHLVELTYRTEPYELLRGGEFDMLAIRLPAPDDAGLMVGPVLSTDSRILIVAKDHPLAGRESVTLNDVADYATLDVPTAPKEVRDEIFPPRAPNGRPIRRTVAVNSVGEALTHAARGTVVYPTVGLILRYYQHPDVVSVPIVGAPPSRAGLVWRTGQLSVAAQAFADVVAEELPRLLGNDS
ncbi:LysR family transcriptional regulator [Nonomuraea jiangxiensis]|uniref:DNA-binding transcriptional regulator, LysR family n=1 Tax=Nonomuraea jiangxiensis TaxID=633440 RepID=A0A1G9HIZ2_9ACTN|nr:LysR family transcriptional regulator [Nonomuraea jiangxiensis]SDL12849.1 DNA-binding transcriptional regulator, LysR family [Nonomuraea jiangxiensis]